jgi:hypothetical protein
MIDPWLAYALLTIEASEVMALRFSKFADGGEAALDEANLMVSEKITAGAEAFAALLGGANSLSVINRYRELVAANYGRLNAIV